jgi:methionyl-tRNA formyltransferase
MKQLNVVLVGEESAAIHTLKFVLEQGHRVVAVLASRNVGSSAGLRFGEAAQRLGCPVLSPMLVRNPDFAARVREQNVDLLLNVHSLYIIDRAVLAAPKIGSFNLHPGPLPRYAGLNAVSWAIYRGETRHGVTLHKMTPDLDGGPIAYQTLCSIENSDSALDVSAKCTRAGVRLIRNLLITASNDPNGIPLQPQDSSLREYYGREVPHDGVVDWNVPARDACNFIRAADYSPFASPWGRLRSRLGQEDVHVLKAERTGVPSHAAPGTVRAWTQRVAVVACADEWLRVTVERF